MGKASRWFRGLLGLKKPDPDPDRPPPPTQPQPQSKKKWGLIAKSSKKKSNHHRDSSNDASQRAVEVANATAAAAEAAVAAAHAAAAFVQLTGSSASGGGCLSQRRGGGSYGAREKHAAVTIQSHFRAYLSRRALRALKALVKLQALVRGHILRKQTAEILRGMQALVRVQARARAGRILLSEGAKSSHFNYTAPATPEKYEHMIKARSMKREQLMMLKRNNSKSTGNITFDQEKSHLSRHRTDGTRIGERSWEQASYSRSFPTDDERADKILEVDTGKPHGLPKYKTLFHSSHLSHTSDPYCQSFSTSSTARQPTVQSPSCDEAQSSSPFKKHTQDPESVFCTAVNSPEFYSASSMGGSSKRAGPFTPTKSDGSRSCLSGYSDHPNYMAYTESSKAKVRSISAPKQRLQHERSSSANRYSVHGYGDSRYNNAHKVSVLHENFANKAYPGSGRLDRLGMPVRGDVSGFSGGHWHRY